MNAKILVIDDDAKLNRLLTEYLGQYGYTIVTCTHPHDGLKTLKREQPDLVILDVMMPDMDGFEVCKQIRKDHTLPVIMLTARGDVTDRIVGLELGADDYLPKPFEPRELLARIQSILRRSGSDAPADRLRFGELTIDLNQHDAFIRNQPAGLTTAEFEILKLLARSPGRVLDREQIIEKIRGIEWEAFDRSVDVLLSRLRQKLGDKPKEPHYIKTVWGAGYMFIARPED